MFKILKYDVIFDITAGWN